MPEAEPMRGAGPAEAFLTVAEASERWGVSTRRVRHVLERSAKHSANVPQTRQKTFRTKTGERSAVAYPADWIGALLTKNEESALHQERSANTPNIPHGNIPKQGAETFQHSAPERSDEDDWKTRAMVAEARAELLEKAITDTQAERDAWKEQATRDSERLGEALRALAQAQDETRAARLISGRTVQQIEAEQQTLIPASGESPEKKEDKSSPWWAFLRRRGTR